MSEHNSDDSRQVKRMALAMMFAVCGRGTDAAEVVDAYLYAGRHTPAELYQAAVSRLVDTWTWPNPPQPGDILRVAKQIHGARRIQAREEKQRREQAEMVADAMTPGQARELLENLQAQPEPTTKEQRAARELQMRLLAVAAVQGGGPKLVKAGSS